MSNSCKKEISKDIISELKNTTIIIQTDSLEALVPINNNSTYCNQSNDPDYKYIIYVDTAQCAPCKLHELVIWQSIINHSKDIGLKVNYYIIFHPPKEQVPILRKSYFDRRINLPIYIDSIGIMERQNPIIKKGTYYHAFIIDKDSHISAIGNAGEDAKIERKYYDFLRKAATKKE